MITESQLVFQGEIALDGSTKITSQGDKLIIDYIVVTNITGDYVFSLVKHMQGTLFPDVTIYEFALEQGDVVRDDERYVLNKGNYIQLNSDIAGTTYHVTATAQ